jgi:hypothetical protein
MSLCKRCGKTIEVHAADADVFEGMHWLCFHLEFEHEGDPDAPCADPSCPWWHLEVLRAKLVSLGINPSDVLSAAIDHRFGEP